MIPQRANRSRSLLPLTAVAVAVLALVLGLLVYDAARSDRVAEGVSVAGVDVGGRSADEAREIVEERVRAELRTPVTAERGERAFDLEPERVKLRVDVDATVDAAIDEGRRGNPISRAIRSLTGGEVDADVEPRVRWSGDVVDRFVEHVSERLDREPRDAQVEPSASGLEKVSARDGFTTDRQQLRSRVVAALERREDRTVAVPGDVSKPDVRLADLAERYPVYVTIDRGNTRLRLFEKLERTKTYPIGVGQAGHDTPEGRYKIKNKSVNPTWYVPDKPWAGAKRGQVIPPGPENPLKARWLGIEDGVGIHGTDDTASIGSEASHGCIRMLIPDVKELYDKVPVGTPVYIG